MVFYNDRKMCRKCNGGKGEIRMSPMINYQLYYERFKQGLEDCWGIATDNSIAEDNKVKMIRDVSRATLDGEPTTADEYNEEEDVQLGASIVKSNREVSGVFMVDGKIKDVDYFKKGEEL